MAKVEQVLGVLDQGAVDSSLGGHGSKEVAKMFRKCTLAGRIKNFMGDAVKGFKEKLPEVTRDKLDEIGDGAIALIDAVRTPLHNLRDTDIDALIEIDAQINKAHRAGDNKLKSRLMEQREKLPSQQVKSILKRGTQKQSIFESDITQDFFDLARLGKRSKAEDKALKYALGGEQGITNNLLIGLDAKGKPLKETIETILEKNGGVEGIKQGRTTGFKDFDKYLVEYGEDGLVKAKVIAKMFRKMSQYAGLPEQRLIDKYFPMVQGKNSVLDSMVKQLEKRFGDESLSRMFSEKFFEKARQSEQFSASEVPIDDALMRYFKATKAILMRKEIKDLIELAKDPVIAERQSDAVATIVQNLTEIKRYNPVEKFILNMQKNIYEGALTNNLSSALNNTTALPILVGSKFGVRNSTAAAIEVAKGNKSIFYNLMEARGIGSSKNALTVILGGDYDIKGLASIDSLMSREMDAFLLSERVSVRIGGIANVFRYFNGDKLFGGYNLKGSEIDLATRLGDSNLVKALEAKEGKPLELFMKSNHPKVKEFMAGLIQEGAADTIFTGYLGNSAALDRNVAIKSAFMFMRHPLRETKFLLQHAQQGDWGTVSRYLITKGLFTGFNGPFFMTNRLLVNLAIARDPELATQIYEYRQKVLNTSIMKSIDWVGNKLHIDFSQNQGLFDFMGVALGKYDDLGRNTTMGRSVSDAQALMSEIGDYAVKGIDPSDKKIAKGVASLYALTFGAVPIPGFKNPQVKVSPHQIKKVYDAAKAFKDGTYEYWGFKLPVNDKTRGEVIGTLYSTTPWQADVIKYQNGKQEFETLARMAIEGKSDPALFKEFGAVAVDPDVPLTAALGGKRLMQRNQKPISRLKAKLSDVLVEGGKFSKVSELIDKKDKRLPLTTAERALVNEYTRTKKQLNRFIDRNYAKLRIEYKYY